MVKSNKYNHFYLTLIIILFANITPNVSGIDDTQSIIASSGSITYPSSESTRIKRVIFAGGGSSQEIAEKADSFMENNCLMSFVPTSKSLIDKFVICMKECKKAY